jgi:hypothetical protein
MAVGEKGWQPYRHLWADCLEKMWDPWRLTTLWAFTFYISLKSRDQLIFLRESQCCGSHNGHYEECYHLCYKAVQFDRTPPSFRKKVCSGSKSKPSKKPAKGGFKKSKPQVENHTWHRPERNYVPVICDLWSRYRFIWFSSVFKQIRRWFPSSASHALIDQN